MQNTITVRGMSCQHCVKAVQNILNEFAGVGAVEVDLASGRVSFTAEAEIDRQRLGRELDDAGYELV